jgi:hypothetical protein
MVALGGVGTSTVACWARPSCCWKVLSTHFEYWQIYVGLILLLVVMVAPRGVSSLATIGKTLKQESSMGREQAAVALSVKGLKKNYGGLAATAMSTWRSRRATCTPSSVPMARARPPCSHCSPVRWQRMRARSTVRPAHAWPCRTGARGSGAGALIPDHQRLR